MSNCIFRQQRKRKKRPSDSPKDETIDKTSYSGSGADTSAPDPSLDTGSCNIDISAPDPSLDTGSCNIDGEREEEHINGIVSCSTPTGSPLPPVSPPLPPVSPSPLDSLFPSDLSSSSKDDNEMKDLEDCDQLLEGFNMSEFSFSFNVSSAQNKSSDKMASTDDNCCTIQGDKVHVYPSGTFYGLPLTVRDCLKKNRRIEQLYGMSQVDS